MFEYDATVPGGHSSRSPGSHRQRSARVGQARRIDVGWRARHLARQACRVGRQIEQRDRLRAQRRHGRIAGVALQRVGETEPAFRDQGHQHFGGEDLGDGVEAQQALAVGRVPVALLGLAVAGTTLRSPRTITSTIPGAPESMNITRPPRPLASASTGSPADASAARTRTDAPTTPTTMMIAAMIDLTAVSVSCRHMGIP